MKKKTFVKAICTFTIGLILISIEILFIKQPAQGATCSWSGGNGDWETAGNWTNCGGGTPGTLDDVVIDANVTVEINGTTTINSLTIGNSGGTTAPILNFDYDAISSGALIVNGGNATIYSGATVTHTVGNTSPVGKVFMDVQSGYMTISGNINVTEKGYSGNGSGPGGGLYLNSRGSGGGYGGRGGIGYSGTVETPGGEAYSNYETPTYLGSSGGGTSSKNGGGAVRLNASTTITIDGTITANGGNSTANYHGGGSGGSIYITAATIAGSGTISANGGNGRYNAPYLAGGGGGGRMLLAYSTANTFASSGTYTATAGLYGNAENGTVVFKDSINDDITIPTIQTWYADPSIDGNSHSHNSINITSAATLFLDSYYTDDTDGTGHIFTVNSFTIENGAEVSGDERGYEKDVGGPGEGNYENSRGSGGAYGAKGGVGSTGTLITAGGNPYGSYDNPVYIGSAGGGSSGKNGGGAIRINATGPVTINGTITMDGGDSTVNYYGGGSGGSIYITAPTISGSGSISADGGNGRTNSPFLAGGGSGGRIMLSYSTSNNFESLGTYTANAGLYGGAENGTVVFLDTATDSLTIPTSQIWSADPDIDGNTHEFDSVSVKNNSMLSLKGYYTTNNDDIGHIFNVTDFTLESGSSINLSSLGFQSNSTTGDGPGGGTVITSGYGSGGGYGGTGGDGINGGYTSPGGATYGDEDTPTRLGSAGGMYSTYTAGCGGGAIFINATGTVTIEGNIYADGGNRNNWSGAGSGGSVYIITATIAGSGNITANGGNGYSDGRVAGGGGGGRITINYMTGSSFAGTTDASQGTYGGSDGTVLFGPLLALGEVLTEINVSNTAPGFSVSPFEDATSTSTTPTNVGSPVTFKATATDVNEDDYYLAICKTNAITPGSSSAPTCTGGNWCISSATIQGTEASCSYETLVTDGESNSWYAFVCDGNACSSSSQGSGDSGSPFEVNHAPTISDTSAGSGNPQGYGSGYTITINTTASDSDTSGSADTTKVVVCEDNSGATSAGCDGGDDLCSSSLVASNPSCDFDLPNTIDDGAYNYYAYVFDSHDFGTNVETSTYTVNSTPPVVTSVTVNNGSDITLNDQTTNGGVTSVTLRATVTDYNSCQDLSSVTGYLYRTGIGYASCTAQDSNNCYYNISCSVDSGTNDCIGSSDDSAAYICTVSMQYHADPTDGASSNDSPWYTETWKDTIKAVDGATGEDDTEVVTGVEVNSTTAFTITTALAGPKITYGNMTTGSDSGLIDDTDTNQITTLTATGNVGLDQEISGTTLIYSIYTIPIANQKHGFSSFTYSSGGTALSGSATQYEQNCLKTTVTGTPATAKTYWGILIPSNSGAGTYSGTNYLNGLKGEASDW